MRIVVQKPGNTAVMILIICLLLATFSFAAMAESINRSLKDSRTRSSDDLMVYVINVNLGDSTLFISPSGKTMLVDTGTTGDVVLDLLDKLYIERIDFLVSTHWHSDHIGGVDEIIAGKDGNFGTKDDIWIGKAIDRGEEHEKSSSHDVQNYLDALDEKGIPREVPETGSQLDLGGGVSATCVSINGEVLGGRKVSGDPGENGNSVGYVVSFGEFDFLVCGDIERVEEELLGPSLDDQDIDVDILHLNHHVSASSNSRDFINYIKPENAVVSVGKSNSFGHPHEEPVENLNDLKDPKDGKWLKKIYQTEKGSKEGTSAPNLEIVRDHIEIKTDGKEYSITDDDYLCDTLDTDKDGIPDIWEKAMGMDEDLQEDSEEDPDEDGLSNLEEYEAWTDPGERDTDEDGMWDGWEVRMDLDPADHGDTNKDPDSDGLSNKREYDLGTHPRDKDSDNDGMSDGWEVNYDLNPLDDQDAVKDSDKDGKTNLEEFLEGTDPRVDPDKTEVEPPDGNDPDDLEEVLNQTGPSTNKLIVIGVIAGIVLIIGIIWFVRANSIGTSSNKTQKPTPTKMDQDPELPVLETISDTPPPPG